MEKGAFSGVCHIMGAGEYTGGFVPEEGDCVIAADGGYETLRALEIRPDFIVGDFDSAPAPRGTNVRVLPREKDDTDTLAAVRIGLERRCTLFHFWGCSGGREDHTYANYQLLAMLSRRGLCGILHGKNALFTAVTDRRIRFDDSYRGMISVFSFSDRSVGVSISGLKYQLCGAELTSDYPLGVSNEFTGQEALIEVRRGTLLIAYERQEVSGTKNGG